VNSTSAAKYLSVKQPVLEPRREPNWADCRWRHALVPAKAAIEAHDAVLASYRQTVLNALAQVADTLRACSTTPKP